MKIAFIIPSFEGGGAERVMINIANGFASKGIEVYLAVLNHHGVYQKEVSDNIQIIDINSNRAIFSFNAINAFINKKTPQIVYSTIGHINILLLIIRLLNRRNDYKVIIRESNTSSQLAKNNSYFKILLVDILRRIFYPTADLIIAPSKGVAIDLKDNYKINIKKIEVVNNPIDYNWLLSLSEKPLNDSYLKQSASKFIIGVGALTKQKDFETLIKAFAIVKKTHNCKLIILGEGPERQTLENLINELNLEEHVHMPGFVKNPFNYLKASDVFVLSSLYEGLPNVLIQAMLLELPCISTNCKSGPKEILKDGEYGQLVEVGDHLEISKAILNVLEGMWKSKSIKGLEKKYSLIQIVNQYLNNPVFSNAII
jgi:glycosyltransferase involved in cell wall biosynthesis